MRRKLHLEIVRDAAYANVPDDPLHLAQDSPHRKLPRCMQCTFKYLMN